MNETTLQYFRDLASAMQRQDGAQDWQWLGKHMSQRMFGISEQRAKEYAQRFGGTARKME